MNGRVVQFWLTRLLNSHLDLIFIQLNKRWFPINSILVRLKRADCRLHITVTLWITHLNFDLLNSRFGLRQLDIIVGRSTNFRRVNFDRSHLFLTIRVVLSPLSHFLPSLLYVIVPIRIIGLLNYIFQKSAILFNFR